MGSLLVVVGGGCSGGSVICCCFGVWLFVCCSVGIG